MAKKRPLKSSKTYVLIELATGQVPVAIITERRSSLRASIGKKHLIFRKPAFLSVDQQRDAWRWFLEWARRQADDKPQQLHHLLIRQYQDGSQFTVGKRQYILSIQSSDRKTASARLTPDSGLIQIELPDGLELFDRSKLIQKVLSRIVAKDFLPSIRRRVHELNQQHFKEPIREIRLKNNFTNWGSCSTRGNINLSTRLLFAPPSVIDYVIIHELTHLVEFNHSSRFWSIIEGIMPDYKQKEQWLKQHFHHCNF